MATTNPEKPNSVCAKCGAGKDCTTHATWRPELTNTHLFEPVAEPAEPSASPLNNSNFNSNWAKVSASSAGGPEPSRMNQPVTNANDHSPETWPLAAAQPVAGPEYVNQAVKEAHDALTVAKPSVEEIARLLYEKAYKPADDDKGDFDMVEAAAILRPFIPASTAPDKCPKCGAINSLLRWPDGHPQKVSCHQCHENWAPETEEKK